ncbi:MAG: hypothetical protein ACLGIJ_08360 [Candidatus Limnocylindria bacterium]
MPVVDPADLTAVAGAVMPEVVDDAGPVAFDEAPMAAGVARDAAAAPDDGPLA